MAEPTKEERAELRKLAEAATPGPWQVFEQHLDLEAPKQQALVEFERLLDGQTGEFEPLLPMLTDGSMCPAITGCGPKSLQNANFIAAANPAVVLSLLDALEAAEALSAAERRYLDAAYEAVDFTETLVVLNRTDGSSTYDQHRSIERRAAQAWHDLIEQRRKEKPNAKP